MKNPPSGQKISQEPPRAPQSFVGPRGTANWLAIAFSLIAVVYAAFAGLRTVGDMDVGWQMATGRWILQYHQIPYTDVFSYTAAGTKWIYPVISQITFYLLYRLGGYSLLSWFSCAACVAIVLLLLRGNTVSKFLAVLAVPLIAAHTAPRAELFSHVLFTATLVILWEFHRTGHAPIRVLPLFMCLWVNLHLGFVAGFAAYAAYILLECCNMLSPELRAPARQRLKTAVPWLALSIVATFLNPWGARMYGGMFTLLPKKNSQTHVVNELMGIPFNSHTVLDALLWREPRSAFWWLFFVGAVAVLVGLGRRRFASALILGAGLFAVLHAIRFQGLLAILVVVIGGAELGDALRSANAQKAWSWITPYRAFAGILFLALTAGLVGVRISDLVTNRYYLTTPYTFSLFGPGESPWYPEQAMAFLEREQLPRNIFNSFNLGGFITWRLPQYPDYIDGRGSPFDPVMRRSFELANRPLDFPVWEREAESRNINTVISSLDRELGEGLPRLDDNCHSEKWRPVYLDTQAALFVRVTPENSRWITAKQIDCSSVQFNNPPTGSGYRGMAKRFNYHLAAASVLISLDRNAEALHSLDLAQQTFPGNWYLHYARAAIFQNMGQFAAAEEELRRSLDMTFDENVVMALDRLLESQERYADEVGILDDAVHRLGQPSWAYMKLGYAQLAAGRPQQALASFDKAEKTNPFGNDESSAAFQAKIDEGRRRCREAMQGQSR